MGKSLLDDAEYATEEEMSEFIASLFDHSNPTCGTGWSNKIPVVGSLEDAEFATQEEVNSFITSLFEK